MIAIENKIQEFYQAQKWQLKNAQSWGIDFLSKYLK